MKRNILVGFLIVFLLLLLGAYLYGSWFFSSILIAGETKTLAQDLARMGERDLAFYGLPAPEEVTIDTGEVELAGWYFENEREGACGVLMLHGYTSTRYGVLQYAPLFWERGCDIFAYDARGHGDSSAAYHTYGYHEKEDGKAALDWFKQRSGLTTEQIGLVGVSYGAATVLQMIPLAQETAFVLSDSPYQDLQAIVSYQAEQQFGNLVKPFIGGAFLASELRADFDAAEVSPRNAVATAEMPVLIFHSLQDEFTPASNSEAIYANSNPATTVLRLTDWGAEHAASIIVDYDTFDQLVDEFLATYVGEFGLENE